MFRNKETCPESDNLQYKKQYYTLEMRKCQSDRDGRRRNVDRK